MADLGEALAKLRALDETGPKLVPLPNERQIAAIERGTGVVFPPDFRRYLLEASGIMFSTLEPVTVIDSDVHTYFPEVLEMARGYGVPADLIPLCEDNADFYCVAPSGEVVFWSHNGWTDERWADIATWIEEVWIGESEE